MSRKTGQQKEQLASDYLEAKGLIPVTRNFHTRYGEIDLVMRDGQTWVCVEVKYRRASGFGGALHAVTERKLKKLVTAFEQFLLSRGLNPVNTPMRLDVVALDGPRLQWLKNVC